MEITYLGHSSFKIKGKNTTIITDPFSDSIGIKFPHHEADIVTISHQHDDHNNLANISNVKKVIAGPGEYEVAGVSMIGVATYHDNEKGAERGKNTVYVYEIDGLRLAHLGDLGHKLEEKQMEEMGDIDVLFIPVGGGYTIDSIVAAEVAQSIEPNFIIPMHYQQPGLDQNTFGQLESVDAFVKQTGITSENTPKLVLKETVSDEEQKIIILERK